MTSNITILVVDDDDGHVELVRRNLRRAGVTNRIHALSNGRDALGYLLEGGAAAGGVALDELLVLLDINMPGGVDGIEVLRQVKQSAAARHIPIIMLTTTDDPREVARCYELGCNVYVTKPVDPGAFIEATHRLGLFISVICLPGQASRAPS